MNAREYCCDSMEQLRANLDAFSFVTHDPTYSSSTWNDIRLNADSLALDFTTALTLEEGVDSELRSEIAALLQRAVDIMPDDVDPQVVEKLQSDIADVLLSAAEDI